MTMTIASIDPVRSNAPAGSMMPLLKKNRPPTIAGRKADAL